MKNVIIFFLVYFCLSTTGIQGQSLPEAPATYTAVNDFANFLTREEQQQLSSKLNTYESRTSTQIVIVTVLSLEGQTVEAYANQLFENWGIGQKSADNGILILLAKAERKIRIEIGYGVERLLTDVEIGGIVDFVMTPKLKKGEFYEAFNQAIDDIISELGEVFKEEKHRAEPSASEEDFLLETKNELSPIVILLILLMVGLIASFLYHLIVYYRFKKAWNLSQKIWHGIGGAYHLIGLGVISYNYQSLSPEDLRIFLI